MLEFVECSMCSSTVKYEGILCDTCQHWVHPHCVTLTPKNLKKLGQNDKKWHCPKCTKQKVNNKNKNIILSMYDTYDECSLCNKNVKTDNSINCSTCRHWIHGKCLGLHNTQSFNSFIKYYQNNDYICYKCNKENFPFLHLDDRELKLTLFETFQDVTLDTESLKMIYNQLDNTNMLENNIFHCDNINDKTFDNTYQHLDPSRHFKQQDNCKYVFNLNEIPDKQALLTVMTFNIRSIRSKFKTFLTHLSTIKTLPDIIAINESWLTDNDNILDYQIDNYHKPIIVNRPANENGEQHGGGLMTYIHKNINNYKQNKHLSFNTTTDQCQVIELKLSHNSKKHTFVNCYRSPNGNSDEFNKKMNDLLEIIKNRKCTIAGDFNYNFLNISTHKKQKNISIHFF